MRREVSLETRNRLRGASEELIASARDLRLRMTKAEARLWSVLRNPETLGCRVRRQHPIGASVIDFFIPTAGLAIELDGAIHDDPEVARHDRERTAWLESEGIRVIRFRNQEVFDDLEGVIRRIREEIDPHPPTPRPRGYPALRQERGSRNSR